MLELKHICKKYDNHIILDDISIQFPSRGMIGIQGESGCGKSSLLYIIGMLDDQFSGEIYNNEIKVDDKESFIKENISYMMQNKDDVISMTVKENIILPCLVSQQKYSRYQLKKVVKQLGIEDYLYVHPDQLSGGQRKRVSIAKALVKQSSIILCDEPTGALNYQQAHEVMKLLKTVSKNALVIIVSHDSFMLEEYCDDVLTLENGKLKGHISASYHEINNHHVHKI
jgi:putative ABC transport system permease protein